MVGFAISIVAFLIVGTFLLYLGMGGLYVLAAIFGSFGSIENKASQTLRSVKKVLGINDGETMHAETPNETLREAIRLYYEILKTVFESETPEERKELLALNTPSGKLSDAFFAISGLGKSLTILTTDLNYVMEGSGWKEYKKLLMSSIEGTVKKIGDKQYQIIFDRKFYLTIAEYRSYGSTYDDENEWLIEGYYNNKKVLNCHAPRSHDHAYIFKPDIWILDILRSAERYSSCLNELKMRQQNEAIERRKSELFE